MIQLASKIFIDGGLPEETRAASELMLKKFSRPLDGQTTNPSLIAKNLKSRMGNGQPVRLSQELALEEYKRIVKEMSSIIPKGSISIQVFADQETKTDEMLRQGRERTRWIPNASIKFPCSRPGLEAAEIACKEFPINITLAFSQAQAAAVYEVTRGAKYPVFISPFVGRLDDRGENGMQVIANIKKLYAKGDRHVEILTASVRTLDHFLYALQLKSNIITTPFKIFQEWAEGGYKLPDEKYKYDSKNLKPIPYEESIALGKNWKKYDLSHELTDKGIDRFFLDWNEIIHL